MKVVIDNQIAHYFSLPAPELLENPLLTHPNNQIIFEWPSLLEYLGAGGIFSQLPVFDQTHPFFTATVSTLYENEEPEVIFYIYDRLFTEYLSQITALPEINIPFLLKKLDKSLLEAEKKLIPTLSFYHDAFKHNPSHILHDLILYLAWDRMCVCIGNLFCFPSSDTKYLHGIRLLKECLIESYIHIREQGRTSPSVYRMLEALFFYEMREEHLQGHNTADWTLLSQSFPVLKKHDELADVFYIDQAITTEEQSSLNPLRYYLTADSPSRVQARLALAQHLMAKLKSDIPAWHYRLRSEQVVFL